jgi:hypothetical protein
MMSVEPPAEPPKPLPAVPPAPGGDESRMSLPAVHDLPAVARPDSGFFIQLFFLPALIIFGLLTVWFLFGRLAGNRSIEELVSVIANEGRNDRWKAADDLARLLREDSPWARDEKLCMLLTVLLESRLKTPVADADEAKFREYLAGALGRFHQVTQVKVLRDATAAQHPFRVRRAALIALNRIAERMKDLQDPAATYAAVDLLKDPRAEIRGLAVMLLGFLGDRRMIDEAARLLEDPAVTNRYNAANALARLGSPKALPVLAEMIDEKVAAEKLERELANPTDADGQKDEDDENRPLQAKSLAEVTLFTAITSLRRLAMDPATRPEVANHPEIPARVKAIAEGKDLRFAAEAKDLQLKLEGK